MLTLNSETEASITTLGTNDRLAGCTGLFPESLLKSEAMDRVPCNTKKPKCQSEHTHIRNQGLRTHAGCAGRLPGVWPCLSCTALSRIRGPQDPQSATTYGMTTISTCACSRRRRQLLPLSQIPETKSEVEPRKPSKVNRGTYQSQANLNRRWQRRSKDMQSSAPVGFHRLRFFTAAPCRQCRWQSPLLGVGLEVSSLGIAFGAVSEDDGFSPQSGGPLQQQGMHFLEGRGHLLLGKRHDPF